MAEAVDKQERKLKKIKINIMRNPKFAFWGSIMMIGRTFVDDNTPTAKTNGRDEYYGRKFVERLNDKELAFVVLHENMHKAYRHMVIWRKLYELDHMTANAACDFVINLQLYDLDPNQQFIAMPMVGAQPMGCIDERFRGMNAKQVFDILREEKKGRGGQKGKGKGQPGEGGGGEDSEGIDEHDWDGAKEMDAAECEQLEREIDRAIRSGALADKSIGRGAGGMTREMEEMMEPKVNWRDQLREFVKSTCSSRDTSSWRRPNRRFIGSDIYLPTLIGEKVGHIVIARDTSGSMGGGELASAAGESKGIAEEVSPERIDLIDWDGAVEKHEQFEGIAVQEVSTAGMVGGGGTDPCCVARYLKDKGIKPECVIILTDGYIDSWGDDELWQNVPVLWAIVGGNKVVAPMGKTIHVND